MYITSKELDRRIDGAATKLRNNHRVGLISAAVLQPICKEFSLPLTKNIDDDVVAQTVVTAAFAPEARETIAKGKAQVKALIERRAA